MASGITLDLSQKAEKRWPVELKQKSYTQLPGRFLKRRGWGS